MRRNASRLLGVVLFVALAACQDDPDRRSESSNESLARENAGESPINVILITIDTLRADALGAYGQERFTSPNLDLLSQEGVRFNQTMTSSPSTLPSHASIMTSRYPKAHGARANAGYVLSDENETLAEIFQRNGYRTGAEIAAIVISHGTQLNQGFDQYRDLDSGDIRRKTILVAQPDGSHRKVELDERPASDITKFGIEFLDKNRLNPFFLWLHYFDPHSHYAAPEAYVNLVPDSSYHAEVRYVDSEIGRLLRHLEQFQLDERTVVVVTADHGEGLGEHGENAHSAFIYQSTMHVPLIFWGPSTEMRKNWSVDAPVRTIDIAPTILEMVDLPPFVEAQGRSLTTLMSGESTEFPFTSYGESIEIHSMFGSSILRTLRRGDWKYIHKLRPELFDLAKDPGELRDLASQHPAKVEEFARALRKEVRSAPALTGKAEIALDEETIRQLRALGYAATTPSAILEDDLESLEPEGPDPSDLVNDLQTSSEGWYYASIMNYTKSAEVFSDLAKRHPRSLTILTSLAYPLIRLERYGEAVDVLHRAIEANPEHEKAYTMLGQSEEALGHLEEAEAATRRALELQPCASDSRLRLATILGRTDRALEQAATLKTGSETCPDSYEVLNNYAYLLSTSADEEIRNGAEAVRIATLAVEKSENSRPAILDTLAGAYAETGDFKSAVQISRRAIELAREKKMPQFIVDALKENLEQFEQDRPSR